MDEGELIKTEEDEERQKPNYIAPEVRDYVPTLGEFITRPIGYGSTIQTAYDPWALQTGSESYKYGLTAIHPAAQPAVKFMAEGPFWSDWYFHEINDYERYPEYEEVDKRVINLINYQIDQFQYETFENTIKSIWKDAFIYGYSVSEINYIFDGNYTIIDTIKTHSPFNFEFYTDQGNNLAQIYYILTGTFIEQETLPKFLVVTYPYIEHGKFFGTSMLQSIYFDVKLIEVLEESYAEGTRRLAIRPIIHHFMGEDMSNSDLQIMRSRLYNLDSGALVSLPAEQKEDGTLNPLHDIKVMDDRASADGTSLIKDLLDILYKRVNRSLGLPDDLGFSNAQIGSFAKAKEEMNLYTQSIVNNQTFIEGFVNRHIIPSMIRYNFPSLLSERTYKLPVFRFGSVEEEYDTATIQNMLELVEAGILDKKHDLEYIREKLGLPAAPPEMLAEPEMVESAPVEEDEEEATYDMIKDEEWPLGEGEDKFIQKIKRAVKRVIRG
jgi:hypothetical protein